MPLELFNQTAQTSIASRSVKRLAYAQPSQAGAENITIENFCKNEIGLTGVTGNVPILDNSVNKLAFNPLFTYNNASNLLGVGIAAPASKIHVDAGTATASYLQFTANATTGQAVTDGSLFGIDSSGNAIWNNQENTSSLIKVNAINKIKVETNKITLYDNAGVATSVIRLGDSTLLNLAWGDTNTLSAITSGGFNTGFGQDIMGALTTGQQNTAIGYRALKDNISGSFNTSIGVISLFQSFGNNNVAVGYNALAYTNNGANNVGIGKGAGYNTSLSTKSQNVYVGAECGRNGGNNNVMVGYGSGFTGAGAENIFLGYYSGFYETGTKKIIIDSIQRTNEAVQRTDAPIYGELNGNPLLQLVRLNAQVQIKGGLYFINSLTDYADDTAAGVGGLTTGYLYRTAGAVMIKL
jgi:hypothetical protein